MVAERSLGKHAILCCYLIPVSRHMMHINSQGSRKFKLQLMFSFLSRKHCYSSLNTSAMLVVDHFLLILLFPSTVPGSPNNLMMIPVNSSCVTLNWNTPGTENVEIAYYQVMCSYWMQRNGWLDTFDDIVEMVIITMVQPNYTCALLNHYILTYSSNAMCL